MTSRVGAPDESWTLTPEDHALAMSTPPVARKRRCSTRSPRRSPPKTRPKYRTRPLWRASQHSRSPSGSTTPPASPSPSTTTNASIATTARSTGVPWPRSCPARPSSTSPTPTAPCLRGRGLGAVPRGRGATAGSDRPSVGARGRLRDRQVMAPGESVLRRAVGSARQAARTTMTEGNSLGSRGRHPRPARVRPTHSTASSNAVIWLLAMHIPRLGGDHSLLVAPRKLISGLLNRLGKKTGKGNRWTQGRVCS